MTKNRLVGATLIAVSVFVDGFFTCCFNFVQTLSIALEGEGSFGLSIAGGGGSPPYIEGDGSVFISRVVPDGPACQAGIKVGDKLVEINGQNVLETEHEAVANLLRKPV